jgi:pimeloyl-ACP methyl ester carboxylesterase
MFVKIRHLLPALLLAAPLAHAGSLARLGHSCHLPGMEEGLRCLTVPVPSDYAAPAGPAIDVHVTIVPALRETAAADPLFILAGGPGQAGSDLLPMVERTFGRVRATRDLVLIDQRGTGLSGRLDCPSVDDPNQTEEQQQQALRDCAARLHKPYADYTTANAARDLDRVRAALGTAQVDLWGGSYGTRLAQAYLRAFPSRVRAAILDGVAAPDQVIPAGGHDAQAALDALFQQCAAAPDCAAAYPQLRTEFATLSARVAAGQVAVDLPDPRTTAPRHVVMSSARFLGTIHSLLYSPTDSRSLPFLVHSAFLGHWEPFIARRNVGSDLSAESQIVPLLHLAVICAEDVPRLTPELVAADAQGSFLGAALLAERGKMCEAVHVPPVPAAAPTMIDTPVLLLSGALDPVTPPRRAQEAARHMRHAQQFVVANAGHGISPLGCAPRLIRQFLDHPARKLDAACLAEIPTASFQLGAAGPQP